MIEFLKNLPLLEDLLETHEISNYVVKKDTVEHTQIFLDEIKESVFFVRSGFIRSYFITDDGSEFTEWIFSKGDIIVSFDGLLYDRLPHFMLQSLEPSLLFKLNKTDYFNLQNKHPHFGEVTKELEFKVIQSQREYREREQSLYNNQLYSYYANKYPSVVAHVKGKDLALLFRVTPTVVSRMKKHYQQSAKS